MEKKKQYIADEERWSNWMVSAQGGDGPGYKILLTELNKVIAAYVRSRFGDFGNAGNSFVEDCVQECLIAIHEARHSYNPKRKFRPWLFAIVRHKSIDCLRRQKSYTQMLDNHTLLTEQNVNHAPNEMLEDKISSGQILSALPKQHCEALTLTKILGFSSAEAAKQLKISEGTLKVRVHRAIASTRKLLEAEVL